MKKFLAVLALLLFGSTPALASGFCNNGASTYFGYCKITGGPWTSVQSTIHIPLIGYNGPPNAHGASDLLAWIGIGTNLAAPVQSGVAMQLNSDGSFTYQAWTGAGSISLIPTNTNPVLVGDDLTVTITCRSSPCTTNTSQSWDFDLTDVHPDGTSWSYQRHGFSSNQNLAWALFAGESPVYGGGNGNIPNFGVVAWYNSLLNGANPSFISSDGASGTDSSLNTFNPSDPNSTADGFNGCYGTNNTYATCGSIITLNRTSAGGVGR